MQHVDVGKQAGTDQENIVMKHVSCCNMLPVMNMVAVWNFSLAYFWLSWWYYNNCNLEVSGGVLQGTDYPKLGPAHTWAVHARSRPAQPLPAVLTLKVHSHLRTIAGLNYCMNSYYSSLFFSPHNPLLNSTVHRKVAQIAAPIQYSRTHYLASSSCNSSRLINRKCEQIPKI